MSVMTRQHELEVLFLVKKHRRNPDPVWQALIRLFLPLLCRSTNRAIAREAGTLYLAEDRRRLGDGDAA